VKGTWDLFVLMEILAPRIAQLVWFQKLTGRVLMVSCRQAVG